ncbi:MAG TPA: hypothetical protein ENF41_00010 [Candidatus Bathyarchaeota archaeon]|nr:hypothetical protein [Candidatus Bathyarchaeota archaeon]
MLFKKKSVQERLQLLIDQLKDARIEVKLFKKRVENQIKKYLKRGKTPPGTLLAAWKISDVLLTTIDSSVISLESAQMMQQVGEAIKEATGAVSFDKLAGMFKELNNNLMNIGMSLRQMVMMQNQLVNLTQSISTNLSSMMNEIAGGTEQLLPEVLESIGAEFLEQLKVNDPELYDSIPEEIKRKYTQSSGE